MGCSGSSESKSDSNKVVPQKQQQQQEKQPLSDVSSIDEKSPKKSIDEISTDYDKYKRRREPEPRQIKEIEIENVKALEGHSHYVDVCSWNPKGDLLVTAATDRMAVLWYLGSDGSIQRNELTVPGSESVSCVHWSEEGNLLAMGTEQGRVMLWSTTGTLMTSWQPSDGIRSVKIKGDYVVSAGNLICVYSIKKQTCQLSCWNPTPAIDAEWVNDEKFLIAEASGVISLDSVNPSKMRKLEDYENDELFDDKVPKRQFSSHTGGVYKVVKNPHRSQTFASCSVDFTIKIWSCDEHKKPKQTLSGHFGYVVDIAWADIDTLVSGSYDGAVKVWNSSSGECLYSLEQHRDHVCSIGVSPNGLFAVSAGHDGYVHFWSVFGGRHVNSFEGPGRILFAGFDGSGTKIVATSYGSASVLEISYHEIPGLSNEKPEEKKKSKSKSKSKH